MLHSHVRFRGSLGTGTGGHSGFAAYVDMVHAALADYRCTIEDLVGEGDKVFARCDSGASTAAISSATPRPAGA